MGLANDILALDDLQRQEIEVPEWADVLKDKPLLIRELTGAERDLLTNDYINAQKADPANPGERIQLLPPNYKARVLQLAALNGDGEPLFKPEHIPALGKKSARVLDNVVAAIMELSGMAGISLEGAREDFEDGLNEGSGLDSQCISG